MRNLFLRMLPLIAVCCALPLPVEAQQLTTSALVHYPATGIWNTYLSQLNVIECNNYSLSSTTVAVTLRDSSGSSIVGVPFVVPGSGTFHLPLNNLVPADSYGTYVVALPGATNDQTDRLRCVTSFYRFGSANTGKMLDYGYTMPVMDPLTGTSGGTFNSFNPEGGLQPVSNWLSIVNPSATALSGSIELYDQSGALLQTVAVDELSPGGRRDVALGHESALNGGQVVGLYRFIPSDPSQQYFAFVIRYSTRGGAFNFAFPLFASRGSCSSEPVFASTMNPALNWAEIGNLSDHVAEVTLETRNGVGTLLNSTSVRVDPFSQTHVFVNQSLGETNTGTLRLVCSDPTQPVFLQSLFYGKQIASSSTVAWAYARQQFGFATDSTQLLAAPMNTFLGMYNWFRVIDRNLHSATVDVETFAAGSNEVGRQTAPLVLAGSADVPVSAALAANSVAGSVAGAPTTGGSLLGDAIRVLTNSRNQIDTIIPVPAAFVPGSIEKVRLDLVASGLTKPVLVTNAHDGSGRLFIIEQGGKIRIMKNGTLLPTPFLDIHTLVSTDGEQGLLGLAFHPSFAANRRFFINYTDVKGDTRVSEFTAPASDPDVADPTEKLVLGVKQPFPNHNGGHLAFGVDGNLYGSLGDGGSLGDPQGNGQNTRTLLGKIFRINIDGAAPYTVPADNPFVSGGGLPEIFAYGFRNPWRFSIDHVSGRVFVGDVGQDSREEVDIVTNGGNYGWSVMEGSVCFNPSKNCNRSNKLLPITEYDHSLGIAVTGGYVYRGSEIPELYGQYVFGDFGSGRIWSLAEKADGTWQRRELARPDILVSSFGEDESSELYVCDLKGSIYRLRNAAL
ncbi:MAG: PQQ-dependent sugar dehydrogenase [Bdellovibrionota bacterium]